MFECTFKVGDLVRVSSGSKHTLIQYNKPVNFIGKVVNISRYPSVCVHPLNQQSLYADFYESEEIELWQPKQGEWCWFWNSEKDLTLQKFYKKQQDYFIVVFCEKHKTAGIIFYDVTDKHFKNCEPFTGELPSFLK